MTDKPETKFVGMNRQAVTLDGHIYQILRERRDAFNSLRERPDLSLPNTVELLLRHGQLSSMDIRTFKPTTRKPGRIRKKPGTPLPDRYS